MTLASRPREADGIVTHTLFLSDHPVRSIKGGFAIFSWYRVHPSFVRRGVRELTNRL